MRTATMVFALAVSSFLTTPSAWGEGPDPKLATALKDAKVSVERGLTASAQKGTPISAKYELEDGRLQLSVYTMKGDQFSEVIVDHKSGKIARSEAITRGEDLTHAKAQGEAMAKAKRSLGAAASDAVKAKQGVSRRECDAVTEGRTFGGRGDARERDRLEDGAREARLGRRLCGS